jgi:Protein of unknown function (DUF4058)
MATPRIGVVEWGKLPGRPIMPMHDWTKVDDGIFHHFHQIWSGRMMERLNAGLLPPDFYALIEQATIRGDAKRRVPDILALEYRDAGNGPSNGMKSALMSRPSTAQKYKSDLDAFRRKKNVLAIRRVTGDRVVAIIEIVSPGNKSGRGAFRDLLEKFGRLLAQGVHLLILDPFCRRNAIRMESTARSSRISTDRDTSFPRPIRLRSPATKPIRRTISTPTSSTSRSANDCRTCRCSSNPMAA